MSQNTTIVFVSKTESFAQPVYLHHFYTGRSLYLRNTQNGLQVLVI